MRFSVDAHAIGCHLTGNEVYIRNLLSQFARLDSESEFFAYLSKPSAGAQRSTAHSRPCRFRRTLSAAWGSICRCAFGSDRPDLLHVQYTGPLRLSSTAGGQRPRRELPGVSAILHALPRDSAEAYREADHGSRGPRPDSQRVFPRRDSQALRDRSRTKWWWCPTLPPPCSGRSSAKWPQPRWKRKFQIRGPFVLMVGDLQPRKNQLGLLRAFENRVARASAAGASPGVRRARKPGTRRSCIARWRLAASRSRPISPDSSTMPIWCNFYGACDLFVFPSFYEGFGLPILEAMACGRAVACSNLTAMPEVADGAGHPVRSAFDRRNGAGHRRRAARSGIARAPGTSGNAARRAIQLGAVRAPHACRCITMSPGGDAASRRDQPVGVEGPRQLMKCFLLRFSSSRSAFRLAIAALHHQLAQRIEPRAKPAHHTSADKSRPAMGLHARHRRQRSRIRDARS